MNVEFHGKPNLRRFGELWLELIAKQEGMEIVPGSVKVILKGDPEEDHCERSA